MHKVKASIGEITHEIAHYYGSGVSASIGYESDLGCDHAYEGVDSLVCVPDFIANEAVTVLKSTLAGPMASFALEEPDVPLDVLFGRVYGDINCLEPWASNFDMMVIKQALPLSRHLSVKDTQDLAHICLWARTKARHSTLVQMIKHQVENGNVFHMAPALFPAPTS